ncbi:hypothetical protein ACJROX_13405 [Pseudalkalibacillus sp. A8]|uniref:hypothetical protein n=1 Tax=Pseudalkalibacillus sp. A8 TaxID=3382641 RepID=UPI0038B4AB55
MRHIEEMTQMEADTKADHILENPEGVPEKLEEPSRTKNATWSCFILGAYQTTPLIQ